MIYVLFLFLLIVLILAIINVIYIPKVPPPTTTYKELKQKMKTGDVIITHSSSYIKGSVMSAYLGCHASHVAMIFERDGVKKIIELIPNWTKPFASSSVRINNLDDYVKNSQHNIIALIPAKKEIKFTRSDEKRYKNFHYNFMVPTMFKPYKKHKVCSTFVAMIHQDKNLIKDDHHLVSHCDFYKNKRTIFFTK